MLLLTNILLFWVTETQDTSRILWVFLPHLPDWLSVGLSTAACRSWWWAPWIYKAALKIWHLPDGIFSYLLSVFSFYLKTYLTILCCLLWTPLKKLTHLISASCPPGNTHLLSPPVVQPPCPGNLFALTSWTCATPTPLRVASHSGTCKEKYSPVYHLGLNKDHLPFCKPASCGCLLPTTQTFQPL